LCRYIGGRIRAGLRRYWSSKIPDAGAAFTNSRGRKTRHAPRRASGANHGADEGDGGCKRRAAAGEAEDRSKKRQATPAGGPNKADTLFNLGIVKWQGKKDGPGAVAAWKKLLETNPAYPEKEAVLQLMAQAQQR